MMQFRLFMACFLVYAQALLCTGNSSSKFIQAGECASGEGAKEARESAKDNLKKRA
jgi:hypothetical protein